MSKSNISTTVETISPKQAKEILEKHNGGNRSIRDRRIQSYAEQMKSGKWQLTGEPIIYSRSGRLLNGQHRLHASIKAGVSFTTVVVRGVEEETFTVIDSGAARTIGDVFRASGHKASNQMATNAKYLMHYKTGKSMRDHGVRSKFQRNEVLDFFESNKAMFEFASSRGVRLVRIGMPRTAAEVVTYILFEADYEGADYFIERLLDGAGLRPTSPILALRNYIIRIMSGSTKPGDASDFLIPTVIGAYNDWATEVRRQRITPWKPGTAMPTPVGPSLRTATVR